MGALFGKDPEPEPAILWSPYPPVSGVERISPQGWVPYEKVSRGYDKVTIKGKKLRYGILADTNSMDRFMDHPHMVVTETDFDRSKLIVGDIISFNAGTGSDILHQIIRIKTDGQGRCYTVQGTNNDRPDPYEIRDQHIRGVLITVIYAMRRLL